MNASLVFQTGLLYDELRNAYLYNSYALVLSKDLKNIIWASPNAASVKWHTVFEAINSETFLANEDISLILKNLAAGNNYAIIWQNKNILIKSFVDFSNITLNNTIFGKEVLNNQVNAEAIIFIENNLQNFNNNLLLGLENANYATVVIYTDGSIASSLFYKDNRLVRHTTQGLIEEDAEFITKVFLKTQNMIFKMHKSVQFVPNVIKYKYILHNSIKFLLTISSFYHSTNHSTNEAFLVTLEKLPNATLNQDSYNFHKIGEILKANCQL